MSPSFYAKLYWARVRAHPLQELLAGVGVMVGVALAFAVMVSNNSIGTSSSAIVRSVTGSADWQLASRDLNGTDATAVDAVRGLRGVRLVAPVLDQRGVLATTDRQVPVSVASLTPDLARMSGRFGVLASGLQYVPGVMLTAAAARVLHVPDPSKIAIATALPRVTLQVDGRAVRLPVAAILGDQIVGPLATAPAAILPLERLQAITGLNDRVTRILVDAVPGREADVYRALAPIAAERHLALTRADVETALLKQALGPSDWTTGFFAAISALLGFMLAFNAVLLTSAERRQMLARMHLLGLSRRQITIMVTSQAAALGVVSSVAGVLLGTLLAKGIFNASPSYLAPAFVPGAATIVGARPILLALGGGVAASVLASCLLLAELRRRGLPLVAVTTDQSDQGNVLGRRTPAKLLAISATCLVCAGALLTLAPAAALGAVALLAVATVTATPAVFRAVLAIANEIRARIQPRRAGVLTSAVYALRGTTIRSLALAATGALAVFGCVSIEGARTDLLRGIARYTHDYVSTADLWIVNGNDNQATNPIAIPDVTRTARAVRGVASARAYRGSFLDWRGRRVWMIARPAGDGAMLPASQLRAGNVARASERLRRGGWAAVSEQLADHLHAGIGETIAVPTPTGVERLRIAALTTNLGWTPGAIIVNGGDYARAWGMAKPTAIEVDVDPGVKIETVRADVAARLGDGVRVQYAADRAAGINASARQGLGRLRQISTLLLIGAVLAMAAAISAAIWQRRTGLAMMRMVGMTPARLWRSLLIETAIVLGAGCLTGVLVGLLGQVAIDRYLIGVTGFPVSTRLLSIGLLETFAAVLVAALAVVAIPGRIAASVQPLFGLQQQE